MAATMAKRRQREPEPERPALEPDIDDRPAEPEPTPGPGLPALPAVLPPVAQPDGSGLECPRCHCRHFWVVWTRPRRDNRIIRRRECRYCGRLMTTTERTSG